MFRNGSRRVFTRSRWDHWCAAISVFPTALFRLAFVLGYTIQVWDLKSDLSETTPDDTYEWYPPQSSFSSDGRFFAYTTIAEGVHIWKESPAGCLPHQWLPFFADYSPVSPRLSPNAKSIIVPPGSKIHPLHARDQVPSLSSVSTKDGHPTPFTLSFSPDENLQRSHGGGKTRSQSLTSNLVNRNGTPTWVWRLAVLGWLGAPSSLLARTRSSLGTGLVGTAPSTSASMILFGPPFSIIHRRLAI